MKLWNVLTSLFFAAVLSTAVSAQTFEVDPNHTQIVFSVSHLSLSEVEGRFNDFDGTLEWDHATPANSKLSFDIDVASVDTGNKMRDDHLRTDDFFGVEKNPKIVFESTKVERLAEDRYTITGDLTLGGVTKNISFPATIRGPVEAKGEGELSMGVHANFTVNRIDYNIGHNFQGGSDKVIGHDVYLRISGQAHEKK